MVVFRQLSKYLPGKTKIMKNLSLYRTIIISMAVLFISCGSAYSQKIKQTTHPEIISGAPSLNFFESKIVASSNFYFCHFIVSDAVSGKVVYSHVFSGTSIFLFDSVPPGRYFAILAHGSNPPTPRLSRMDVRSFVVE